VVKNISTVLSSSIPPDGVFTSIPRLCQAL